MSSEAESDEETAAQEAAARLDANDAVLTQLNLSHNGIDDAGATEISEALAFNTVLTQLDLTDNEIDNEGTTKISEALAVNTVLTQLDLSNNCICNSGATSISEALAINTVLTQLDLSRNEIVNAGATEISEALAVNTVLTQLDLSRNYIGKAGATKISEALAVNTVLTELDLSGNPICDAGRLALGKALCARALPAAGFKLPGISLGRRWEALKLPEAGRGWTNKKVLAYFAEVRAQGAAVQPRVKLMLVGSGNTGKSTLLRRLQTGTFVDNIPTTDGIEVASLDKPTPDRSAVQLVVWDFGGQPIYQATHPFFFTKDCVYLVIWNPRSLTGPLDKELSGYVRTIRSRAGDAHILFVSTHADTAPPGDIKATLDAMVGGDAKHFHVSSREGQGIEELQRHLAELTAELGGRQRAKLPHSFLRFEEKLADLRNKVPCGVLQLESRCGDGVPSVHQVARECDVTSNDSMMLALQVLKERGSILHFAEEELQDIVFADPAQLASLMATTITYEEEKKKHLRRGVMEHGKPLDTLWKDFPAPLRPKLLKLLYHLEVAYPLPNGTSSLVPAMLPPQEPAAKGAWLEQGSKRAGVQMKLEPLPPDFLPRLLVRTSKFAFAEGSWQYGALLEREGERAVVQLDLQTCTLRITCAGNFPMGLRGQVFHTIEHLLQQWFKDVKLQDVKISCPAPGCTEGGCTSAKLSRKIKEGKMDIKCDVCREKISIADLASGVVPLNEAEEFLKRDLAASDCRPERLELMRRDVIRVLQSRLGVENGAGHPLLWVATRDEDGIDRVIGVCEHPGGWHIVPAMRPDSQGMLRDWLKSFKNSDYWKLMRAACSKLMSTPDLTLSPIGSEQETHEHLSGGFSAFLTQLHEGCPSDRKDEQLQRVRVKGGPPQWLCPEHAAEHAEKHMEYVQWTFLNDSGEYVAYDGPSNDAIERAFKSGHSEIDMTIGPFDFKYTIMNLQTDCQQAMVASEGVAGGADAGQPSKRRRVQRGPEQQNLLTGKRRAVVRRVFSPPYFALPPLPYDEAPHMGDNFQLIDVSPNSELWTRIDKRVRESLPKYSISKIERVVNKFLWERYCTKSYDVAHINKGHANERELFHWSKDFRVLIEGTSGAGFDPRMKDPEGCEYGNGVYFAKHAAYCVSYAQGWLFKDDPPPHGQDVQVLLALVSLGDCRDFGPLCSSERGNKFATDSGVAPGLKGFWKQDEKKGPKHRNRGPPKDVNDDTSALYDSVGGTEANLSWSKNPRIRSKGEQWGQQYVVFEPAQAYPSLLITLSALPPSPPLIPD